MSLYGTMRTGVSGMNAQANRLGTVADNIANASTTGYKRASTEFSSMILASGAGQYNSGGVNSNVRYSVSEKGAPTFTSSPSDLAIDGNGFFIVSNTNGTNFLTRAGSFQQNATGDLVNAAGFTLMGYEYKAGVDPTVVVNSFEGLTKVNVSSNELIAVPTTTGKIGDQVPANSEVGYKKMISISVYDTQGNPRLLNFEYEKTGIDAWKLNISEPADSAAPVQTFALTFYGDGKLKTFAPTSGAAAGAAITYPATTPATITLAEYEPVAGGKSREAIAIDISKLTQYGGEFQPGEFKFNGTAPSKSTGFQISADGVVSIKFANGTIAPRFRIPLADVQSPDKLEPLSGNVYQQSVESGIIVSSFAQTGSFGKILSSTLEGSNVDMASELTMMIEAQRSYTANSKVFQTGADLMDVLVNLKR